MRFPTVLICLTLALGACAAPVAQKQYLMEAPAPADAARLASIPPVGLREIALPLYARRPQMAVLEEDGSIVSSDDYRWAEDPPRAATRLIARRMEARGGDEVYAEPWPLGADPALIVTVEVDKLIGGLGGTVELTGEIIVARRTARDRPVSTPFAISAPADGPDYGALARAYSAALATLGDRTAEAAAEAR